MTTRSTAASKYDDQKQELSLDQFGGSIGGPIATNQTFFFVSYEGLRQTTGLSFTEAVPSAEARRSILAGEPAGRAAAGARPARMAVAPLLAGFPLGTTADRRTRCVELSTPAARGRAGRGHARAAIRSRASTTTTPSTSRYLFSDGNVDTPDRTVTPRRVRAKQRPQNFVATSRAIFGSSVNEFKVGYNKPQTSAVAFGPAGYDPVGVSLSGHVHLVVDRRARQHRHRAQRPADSRDQRLDHDRLVLRPELAVVQRRAHLDARARTRSRPAANTGRIQSEFQFLGSTEITYNSINDFIDNRPTRWRSRSTRRSSSRSSTT